MYGVFAKCRQVFRALLRTSSMRGSTIVTVPAGGAVTSGLGACPAMPMCPAGTAIFAGSAFVVLMSAASILNRSSVSVSAVLSWANRIGQVVRTRAPVDSSTGDSGEVYGYRMLPAGWL